LRNKAREGVSARARAPRGGGLRWERFCSYLNRQITFVESQVSGEAAAAAALASRLALRQPIENRLPVFSVFKQSPAGWPDPARPDRVLLTARPPWLVHCNFTCSLSTCNSIAFVARRRILCRRPTFGTSRSKKMDSAISLCCYRCIRCS